MASARRLAFIDIAKGIGILAVIALHSSGRSTRVFEAHGEPQWWSLVIFNRLLAFAVPLFFSVSAFLWALGARGKEPTAGSVWRRLAAILHPYLIWSAIFLAWTVLADGSPARTVFSPRNLFTELVWGKAYFHLYFLSVLMQATIVFPILMAIVARTRFITSCLIALILQALVFWLQSRYDFLRFPASTVLWYLTNLIPAAWLGAHWPVAAPKLRLLLWPSLMLTLAGGGVYLWQQILDAQKISMNSMIANSSQQLFVFGASFTILAGLAMGHSDEEHGSALQRWLCWLGAASLPLYLMHPILMRFLGGPHIVSVLSRIPGAPILSFLMLLVATILVTLGLRMARIDKWLFGRETPPLPLGRNAAKDS